MLDRIFIWTCNYCLTTVSKRGYGLPDGWVYVNSMGEVPHACGECTLILPTNVRTSQKHWDADCLTFEI